MPSDQALPKTTLFSRSSWLQALVVLVTCTAGIVAAQTPAAPALPEATPAQAVAPGVRIEGTDSADALLRVANQALQALDARQAASLWPALPAVVAARISQVQFVEQLSKERGAIGPVLQRQWVTLGLVPPEAIAPELRAIRFANVFFLAQLPNEAAPLIERMSLAYEAPLGWRMVGYVVLTQQALPAGAAAAPASAESAPAR